MGISKLQSHLTGFYELFPTIVMKGISLGNGSSKNVSQAIRQVLPPASFPLPTGIGPPPVILMCWIPGDSAQSCNARDSSNIRPRRRIGGEEFACAIMRNLRIQNL